MADESKRKRKVEFARKQLEKHGWCEGKGLGKEESGISKAIKVNIKTDTAGVGYDAGDQFSFHWWDHIFNKTAKSIVVQESDEGVEVVKSSNESCVVSSKRPSKNANKPLLYGRFVKASSQTQESVTPDSDGDSDAEKDFSNLCTEDKVFQACGGRTAHKAARHGFRLNGKLRRVQEQDKIAMAVESTTEAGCDSDNKIYENGEEQQIRENENKKKVKSKKKDKDRKNRKRKHRDTQKNNGQNLTDECDSCEGDAEQKQTKKKKRRKNKSGRES